MMKSIVFAVLIVAAMAFEPAQMQSNGKAQPVMAKTAQPIFEQAPVFSPQVTMQTLAPISSKNAQFRQVDSLASRCLLCVVM